MSAETADATERCDTCGQDVAVVRYRLHARGLDGAAPECPKQDLVEIAMRKRGDWEAMRQRFQNTPRTRLVEDRYADRQR